MRFVSVHRVYFHYQDTISACELTFNWPDLGVIQGNRL